MTWFDIVKAYLFIKFLPVLILLGLIALGIILYWILYTFCAVEDLWRKFQRKWKRKTNEQAPNGSRT